MTIPELTPAEAHDVLSRDSRALYLDVRTESEFAAGHPAGARNVPVVLFDPASGGPKANPYFLDVVERNVPRDAKLIVGCQSGGRSMRACELLRDAGFADVTNVRGGFGGVHDRSGRVVEAGWADAGLPVESGQPPGTSYADLAGKR
jgi:rhodanese-related sulfurtransferase